LKIFELPRAKGVSDRLVGISLAARFMDELLGGLPAVLMPTIRSQLGLSYSQVGLLSLTINYVSAIVEPINGLLIDLWKRPWLMAWGAAGIGLGTMVIGLAPTLAILMLGFAIYGLASGPLAHTADVVLVESYPDAPDRIYTRATALDTLGALLGPLSVAAVIWLGLEWRWLMVSLGFSSLLYAIIILRTHFPPGVNSEKQATDGFWKSLTGNLRMVLHSKQALRWLLFLFVLAVLESPMQFTTIWLREQVGMSQALIGLYQALQMAVGIISLLYLDRWLSKRSYRHILLVTSLALLVLYPIWLWLPGIWPRFVLSIPISFLFTVYWPIGKAQSLVAVPGRGGTITAIQSLLGFIPLTLLFGLLAESFDLTSAMLWIYFGGALLMVLLAWQMPSSAQNDGEAEFGSQP
jgi:FSR family fosmidomycin resistance protein-like MFS transporter